MSKSAHNDVLDGLLNVIKTNCDKMVLCAGQPTTFAEANTGGANNLADVAMASGDFTIADGDTQGRKVTMAQKTGAAIDASGAGDHIALLDTVNSKLLYVTTATSQSVTAGNTMTFNSWKINVNDPS